MQAKAERLEVAEELLQSMLKEGVQPTTISYNILIDAASRAGNTQRALQVLEEDLPNAGLRPDTVTFNAVLFAFAEVCACRKCCEDCGDSRRRLPQQWRTQAYTC